jgi:hypothetical protein
MKHQLLAIFCSLQAWQRGLDCIWINRFDLYRYLHVDRLTTDTVLSLARAFKPWFPHHEHDIGNFFGEWENSVKFSRFPESEISKNRIGNLNIPKSGLTEEVLWHGISSMLIGFNEPKASLGFTELDRELEREQELAPFKAWLEKGATKTKAIMDAHGCSEAEAMQKMMSDALEQTVPV